MSWAIAAPILGAIAGGAFNNYSGQQAGEANADLQKQFAMHGVRWKVDDAKRAGVHPLYALGAQTHAANPSFVGDQSLGNAVSDMGQHIGRAISTTQTQQEKQMAALQLATAQAQLDGQVIDNQYRAAQLQKLNGGPSFPGSQNMLPGQGNSPILNKPLSRTTSKDGYSEPGAITSVGYGVNADGSLTPIPSGDIKERIEDNLIQETMHAIRNNLLPNFTGGNPPAGYHWDRMKQGYVPNRSVRPGPFSIKNQWKKLKRQQTRRN